MALHSRARRCRGLLRKGSPQKTPSNLAGGGWAGFVGCGDRRGSGSGLIRLGNAVRSVRKSSGAVGSRDFHFFTEGGFEFVADVFVFLEENAGVFAALAHAFAGVADPSARLFEDALIDAEVDEIAFAGNAFAVE